MSISNSIRNTTKKRLDTPQKAKIQGAFEQLEASKKGAIYQCKQAIFDRYGVSKQQGNKILEESLEGFRDFPHNEGQNETRGRKSKISQKEIEEMERIMKNYDYEGHILTWESLKYEAGIEVSERTVRRVMGRLDYYKCIGCNKGWVNRGIAKERMKFAEYMLHHYPEPDDWKIARFSDEIDFGLNPQGKVHIIRKPGERYCSDCIQDFDDNDSSEEQKLHAWGTAGYEFKSELVFYEVAGNKNGKSTSRSYEKRIHNSIVKPWTNQGIPFGFKKDDYSRHGGKHNQLKETDNIIQPWKRENKLTSYFDCQCSADLSPIEDFWQPVKHYIRKYRHWDRNSIQNLAKEVWYDDLKQEKINQWCLNMPKRFKDVIEAEGKLLKR